MPDNGADKQEARDVREAERGDRFERFIRGEPVPSFFADDLLPLFAQHYAMWLEKVKAKQSDPEVLKALDDLLTGMRSTVNLGRLAHERLIRRRFGKLQDQAH